MNWKCFFGFHPWEEWYDIGDGTIKNLLGMQEPVLYQERICSRCQTKERQYIRSRDGR
jgi:hypothetical protein